MKLECFKKKKKKAYTERFIVTFHHFVIEVLCVPVSFSLLYDMSTKFLLHFSLWE